MYSSKNPWKIFREKCWEIPRRNFLVGAARRKEVIGGFSDATLFGFQEPLGANTVTNPGEISRKIIKRQNFLSYVAAESLLKFLSELENITRFLPFRRSSWDVPTISSRECSLSFYWSYVWDYHQSFPKDLLRRFLRIGRRSFRDFFRSFCNLFWKFRDFRELSSRVSPGISKGSSVGIFANAGFSFSKFHLKIFSEFLLVLQEDFSRCWPRDVSEFFWIVS